MYGLVLGDVAGSVWEGGCPPPGEFNLTEPSGRFTDDSCLAAAIMEATVVDHPGEAPYADNLRAWFHLYPTLSYGSRFRLWAATEGSENSVSPGNGAAMRSGPLGMVAASMGVGDDALMDWVLKASRPSHDNEFAIKGAQAIALAVRGFLMSDPKHQVLDRVSAATGYKPAMPGNHLESYLAKETVPVALWAGVTGNSLEEVISLAVNAGGDTDTIGAMAGAIGEARFGISDELKAWTEGKMTDPMLRVFGLFYARHCPPRRVQTAQISTVEPSSFFARIKWRFSLR